MTLFVIAAIVVIAVVFVAVAYFDRLSYPWR